METQVSQRDYCSGYPEYVRYRVQRKRKAEHLYRIRDPVISQAVETDIHVVAEPAALLSLAAGIALLGLLHRWRTANA